MPGLLDSLRNKPMPTTQAFRQGMMQAQASPQRRELPPLGDVAAGRTPEGRPIIQNPDGSYSTERTATIEVDGEYLNIPTMFGGRQVSEREAFDILKQNNWTDPETGRSVQFYKSLDEAVRAAEGRSHSLEQYLPK